MVASRRSWPVCQLTDWEFPLSQEKQSTFGGDKKKNLKSELFQRKNTQTEIKKREIKQRVVGGGCKSSVCSHV